MRRASPSYRVAASSEVVRRLKPSGPQGHISITAPAATKCDQASYRLKVNAITVREINCFAANVWLAAPSALPHRPTLPVKVVPFALYIAPRQSAGVSTRAFSDRPGEHKLGEALLPIVKVWPGRQQAKARCFESQAGQPLKLLIRLMVRPLSPAL
jgi:hypothetical protein